MRVGPTHWRMVSTDTAGVPTGGRYGNVRWFEGAARRHGLYVAWSRRWRVFSIYTRRGPSAFVHQMLAMRQDDFSPIPLTADFLALLVWLWERHSRMSVETIQQALQKLQREERQRLEDQRRSLQDYMEPDVMHAVDLRRRLVTPSVMVLPKGPVRIWHGRGGR